MSISNRLRRLEREAEEEMIVIPQKDGTARRFPSSAGIDAYMNLFERLGAGEDAPLEHPLIAAARNSSDPKWSESFYAANEEGWTEPVADLSE